MEVVKETKEYTIYKKKSGRYGVKDKSKKWVNSEEKVKILLSEGLIKVTPKKKEEPAEVEQTETESEPSAEA